MYFDSKILSQNSTQESNFELNYESNFESILQHTKSKHQPGIKKEEDKNKNSGQVCFDVVVTLNPSGRVFFCFFSRHYNTKFQICLTKTLTVTDVIADKGKQITTGYSKLKYLGYTRPSILYPYPKKNCPPPSPHVLF